MTDLTRTISPKSDQLNADDLIGRTLTIKVSGVKFMAEPDQPIAISYEGDNGKPYKPCKSMRRVLVSIWGGDGNAYAGRRMTLYRDDKVQFGGMAVGGIRISHMSDIDRERTMALTATKASRKPYTVKPLAAEEAAVTRQEAAEPAPELIQAGDDAASRGKDSLQAWWTKSITHADRVALGQERLDRWKTAAVDMERQAGDAERAA